MNAIAIQQLQVDLPRARRPTPPPSPHKGRNALDAAVLGYMNVAALRQHIRPDERIHGIFTEAGDKPNIVPGPRRGRVVRPVAARSRRLEPLKARVLACLRGRRRRRRLHDGATSGRTRPTPTCVDNEPLVDLYAANAGRARPHARRARPTRCRSWAAPTWATSATSCRRIHPMIEVSPPDVAIHTPEFAALRRRRPRATGPCSTGPRPWP